MTERKKNGVLRAVTHSIGKGLALMAVCAVALVGWAVLSVQSLHSDSVEVTAAAESGGWGSEVFNAVHVAAIADGLIKPANACGLGASSCFKCHNGTRAAAPSNQIWHSQHEKVNGSCVGCHSGNPRLMRQEMAHKDLVGDPRANPEICASCHKGGDLNALVEQYRKVGQ